MPGFKLPGRRIRVARVYLKRRSARKPWLFSMPVNELSKTASSSIDYAAEILVRRRYCHVAGPVGNRYLKLQWLGVHTLFHLSRQS
jgi:hypothetical protein